MTIRTIRVTKTLPKDGHIEYKATLDNDSYILSGPAVLDRDPWMTAVLHLIEPSVPSLKWKRSRGLTRYYEFEDGES